MAAKVARVEATVHKSDRVDRIADLVRTKLRRMRDARHVADRRPRVVDLFSGCGGLFLGFHRAGAISVGGVEVDPLAAGSYSLNFHADAGEEELAAHAASLDITSPRNSPANVLRRWGHDDHGAAVDLVIGGPPCPAFARVGRAKLREVREHPEAFRHDPRVKLWVPYLKFVEELAPVALLMENVPDILNHGGHNLGEEICEAFDALGYECAYTLLNAANYGVPQMRERFLLLAIHSAVGVKPSFPMRTHRVEFPPGYEGSRQVALKHIAVDGLVPIRSHYVPTPRFVERPACPITAREALADLPPITAHLEGNDRRGARRFTDLIRYRDDVAPSAYVNDLRTWPGFESRGGVVDHVTRCLTDRDYRLFRRMSPGDDYPKAHKLAVSLFEAKLRSMRGKAPRVGTAAWNDIRAEYVPPYDPGKFPNKWRKMEPDQPARTLMAHLGKDTYSHIHYSDDQARTITVREAARLQSFPDGFAFRGTMNPAFRQIGNSVPPLLSYALARHMLALLSVSSSDALATARACGADTLDS